MDHDLDPPAWGPYCPYYAVAGDVLSRRWAPTVLRALVTGPKRFSEMAAAIPDMTDRLLAQRLRDLEDDGLVERALGEGRPARVEYRLTVQGAELGEVLLDLNRWALKWVAPKDHDPGPETPATTTPSTAVNTK